MNEAASDASLAADAARDVPGAFDALARRYQVPLLRFLTRSVRRDAEDVLQETFARLFVGRRAFRPTMSFRTWAFTIARRCAIDHARRRAARPAIDALLRESRDPAHDAAASDERRSLWATARRVLTDDQLQAMWLVYAESMSPRDVARVLGKTGLGVRALLARGRRRLRAALVAVGRRESNGCHDPCTHGSCGGGERRAGTNREYTDRGTQNGRRWTEART